MRTVAVRRALTRSILARPCRGGDDAAIPGETGHPKRLVKRRQEEVGSPTTTLPGRAACIGTLATHDGLAMTSTPTSMITLGPTPAGRNRPVSAGCQRPLCGDPVERTSVRSWRRVQPVDALAGTTTVGRAATCRDRHRTERSWMPSSVVVTTANRGG